MVRKMSKERVKQKKKIPAWIRILADRIVTRERKKKLETAHLHKK